MPVIATPSRSRSIAFVLLAFALLVCAPAQSKERPLLAVLDFEGANAGLNSDEVIALTEDARKVALAVLAGRYDIITRENLVDLLKSHGKTLEQCQGECETETGRLIGAELVVTGRVARVFGAYKLTVKIHQTDPPKLLGIQDANTEEMKALPGLLQQATRALLESAAPRQAVRTGRRASEKRVEKGDDDWAVSTSETAFVTFRSVPAGAEVWLDGKSLGRPQPGKDAVTRRIPRGEHTVEMAVTLYKAQAKTFRVSKARETIELRLKPNFAELNLDSKPSGLPVFIDGDEVGETPIRGKRLIAGPHDLRVADRCHFEWTDSVVVVPEEDLNFAPKMKPKMSAVTVEVRFRGDDVPAVLSVDGKERGPTPGPYKVPLCSKRVTVVPEDGALNKWSEPLELEHRDVWRGVAEVSDHESIAAAATQRQARDEFLSSTGFMRIEQAFRMMGDRPGARLTVQWQPGFLDRYVFVGVDAGYAKGTASAETHTDQACDTCTVQTEQLDHRRVLNFHWVAGAQVLKPWGGLFVRGLTGTVWEGDKVHESDDSHVNSTERTIDGWEAGVRYHVAGETGFQATYGHLGGEPWVSLGFGSSFSGPRDASEVASRANRFVGNTLSLVQVYPVGILTFLPLYSDGGL